MFYRLSLRNLTGKNISALELYEAEGGRRSGRQMEIWAGSNRPLIAAGAVHETHVNGGGVEGRTTPQGFVPDPPRRLMIVIGTVIFDDGTYEGEAEVAARMEARRAGRQLQLGRVVSLLKASAETTHEDAVSAIEGLKSEISALRIDVDRSVVNELLARYPSLAANQRRELMARVMDGLRSGRAEALHALEAFGRGRALNSRGGDFRAWLRQTLERYEAITRGR